MVELHKINIRIAKKGDGKGIINVFNEGLKRGFSKYTGSNKLKSSKSVKTYENIFSKHNTNEFIFVAVDKQTNNIVGVCTFVAKKYGRTRHRGEVGWGVHPDFMNQGIGTTLLKKVISESKKRKFKKIEAEIAINNKVSLKLAKKCHLKIEGRKKYGLRLDNGRYVDTLILGKSF